MTTRTTNNTENIINEYSNKDLLEYYQMSEILVHYYDNIVRANNITYPEKAQEHLVILNGYKNKQLTILEEIEKRVLAF